MILATPRLLLREFRNSDFQAIRDYEFTPQ